MEWALESVAAVLVFLALIGFREKARRRALHSSQVQGLRRVPELARTVSPAPLSQGDSSADDSQSIFSDDYSSLGNQPAAVRRLLLAVERRDANLVMPLQAALECLVSIGNNIKERWDVEQEFAALENKLQAVRVVATLSLPTSDGNTTYDNIRAHLQAVAELVHQIWNVVAAGINPESRDQLAPTMQNVGDLKRLLKSVTALLEVFEFDETVTAENRMGIIQQRFMLSGPTVMTGQHSVGILNQNSNMTYNFGRDVVNNNSVNNYVFSGRIPSDFVSTLETMKRIKSVIGVRFVPEALHDTQPNDAGCMPGTRTAVLSRFMTWAKDDPMRIFWLAGLAGTGKTSIAVTLCRYLQDEPAVLFGGAFFCSRSANMDERTDARFILPTLAVSLAEKSPLCASVLMQELNTDSRAAVKPIPDQLDSLFQRSLLTLASSDRPIVFVIDALDECKDETEVKRLLKAIADFTSHAKVKFILTSRPETHINTSPIATLAHNAILRLHTIDSSEVAADIRLYMENSFSQEPLVESWYSEEDVQALTSRADGLFIFASTIIRYILDTGSPDARKNRIRKVLSTISSAVAMGTLDTMYEFVLTQASNASRVEPEELEVTRQVLACILTARMPLSVAALADLLGSQPIELRESLRRITAVVHVPLQSDQPELRTLHTSFGDYLFHRAGKSLMITASLGNNFLARGCLQVMRNRLHFNVSQSCSSYEPNPQAKSGKITLSLEYACLHWVHHVATAADPLRRDEDISKIIQPRFLFWLEVLSVLGQTWRAASILFFAASIVQLPELSVFLLDAHTFVISSREVIERSASHIYLSALPFAMRDSLIYKTFSPLCSGLVSVETFGINRRRERLLMNLDGHESEVLSIAYSPDGLLLATGSVDGAVRIWDARNGEQAMPSLRSNEGAISSIVFAPNGSLLAAGTDRGGTCVWDLSQGHPTPRWFRGNSPCVWSVAFSPDSSLLLSASDRSVSLWTIETGQEHPTALVFAGEISAVAFSRNGVAVAFSYDRPDYGVIRLWQVVTGEFVGQQLNTSGSWVFSATLSFENTRFAVGHQDGTIQIWEPETGKCVATLLGHTGIVRCLQFSSDGQSLLSSASEHNVRLWKFQQDAAAVEASSVIFEGHTDVVMNATFSPDGRYIASASRDCTIKIWNAKYATSEAEPLRAQYRTFFHAAIASDSSFIVCGFEDGSICILDAHTGKPMRPPLLGHTDGVSSVAISSDGRLIASAAWGETVRLWDARTGEVVCEPLKGHEPPFAAFAFSPDSKQLALSCFDGKVYIWDIAAGTTSNSGPLDCTRSADRVAFSPDGRFIVAVSAGLIHICNAQTGQLTCEPIRGGNQDTPIAFSPVDDHFVYGEWGRSAYVSNIMGERVLMLEGYVEREKDNEELYAFFQSFAYSPDGRFIGTGTIKHTVILWQAATGTRISEVPGYPGSICAMAFSADGSSLISCSSDTMIRIWDVEAALSLSSSTSDDLATKLAYTKLKDGWLLGSSGELLLWVPEEYRDYLHIPPYTNVTGQRRVSVMPGSGNVFRGENWTSCWSHAEL